MRRAKEPWFRKFNDTWYVWHGGKQVSLAKGKDNKDQAYQAFYRLMAGNEPQAGTAKPLLVITLLDLFLENSQRHNKPNTYDWHRYFLQDLAKACGRLPVTTIKPFHVTRWLDVHAAWTTSRRGAISCVKRAFNWAVGEGLIEQNPIRNLKKPPSKRRERILTPEEQQLIYDNASDQNFREFLLALRESGARPGEVTAVTAANVDFTNGVWKLDDHKTKGRTQKPRIIYLTPALLLLSKRLVERHPNGPLFRNSRGDAWNRNSIRCRFRRLRKKLGLGKDVVCYSYRHTYATDALVNGVPVVSVAELLGHQDVKMVAEVYGHLSEKRKHLLAMAKKATERPAAEDA